MVPFDFFLFFIFMFFGLNNFSEEEREREREKSGRKMFIPTTDDTGCQLNAGGDVICSKLEIVDGSRMLC